MLALFYEIVSCWRFVLIDWVFCGFNVFVVQSYASFFFDYDWCFTWCKYLKVVIAVNCWKVWKGYERCVSSYTSCGKKLTIICWIWKMLFCNWFSKLHYQVKLIFGIIMKIRFNFQFFNIYLKSFCNCSLCFMKFLYFFSNFGRQKWMLWIYYDY